MGKSNIEWLNGGKTWNPIRARNRETGEVGWYCQKVSKLCAGCYAERMNQWRGTGVPYAVDRLNQVELFLDEKVLEDPLRWKKPSMVFPCSMTDLFGDFVPFEWIEKIYTVMAATSHTYQILTKRPQRRLEFYQRHPFGTGLTALQHGNLWEGLSVGTQEEFDRDIEILRQTPATVRWLSMEPLLEYVHTRDLRTLLIDWVVAGGESGPKARPSHPGWFRHLRNLCQVSSVPFFFKQWGEWAPTGPIEAPKCCVCAECAWVGDFTVESLAKHEYATGHAGRVQLMYRVGKKAAGRVLDHKEHGKYPEIVGGVFDNSNTGSTAD